MTKSLPTVPHRETTASPPQRECGACSACCYAVGVSKLNKGQWKTCNYQSKKGCQIYGEKQRPLECAVYECLWLAGMGKKRDRPDRLGMIFDVPDMLLVSPIYQGISVVACKEFRPGASKSKRGAKVLEELQKTSVIIMLRIGGKRELMGPSKLVHEIVKRIKAQANGKLVTIDPPVHEDGPQ